MALIPEEMKNTMRLTLGLFAAFIVLVILLISIAWGVYLFVYNSTPMPREAYEYIEEVLITTKTTNRLTPIYLMLYLKTRQSSFAPTKKELHTVRQIFECLNEDEQIMVIENTHSEISLLTRALQALQKKRSNNLAIFGGPKTCSSSNSGSSKSSSSSSSTK